jgi:hypothetical protein
MQDIKTEYPQVAEDLKKVFDKHPRKRAAISFMLFKMHQIDLNWKENSVK